MYYYWFIIFIIIINILSTKKILYIWIYSDKSKSSSWEPSKILYIQIKFFDNNFLNYNIINITKIFNKIKIILNIQKDNKNHGDWVIPKLILFDLNIRLIFKNINKKII